MSSGARTLIPQYSIRLLLMVMAGCAVVFSIFGLAVRGNAAAVGISLAAVGLAVVLLTHAVVFGLVWLFHVLTEPLRRKPSIAGRSPFAAGGGSPFAQQNPPDDDNDTPAMPILLE